VQELNRRFKAGLISSCWRRWPCEIWGRALGRAELAGTRPLLHPDPLFISLWAAKAYLAPKQTNTS